MEYKIEILKRADLEIEEAYLYYENISEGLGEKFILIYEDYLYTLKNIPFFEQKYHEIRILPLKKFPYSVHFSVNETKKLVLIHAVTCDYQNPELNKVK